MPHEMKREDTGKEEALLVDPGFEDGYVYEAAGGITDLPVHVIMIYGDTRIWGSRFFAREKFL